jgi:hypothetical protein
MAFKPNYRHERSERARSKAAKAQQKLKDREEKAALRKAGEPEDGAVPEDGTRDEGTPED